jgi:hypothetical protein
VIADAPVIYEDQLKREATVNAMAGSGMKGGSGQGKKTNKAPAKMGGAASAHRSAAARSASARKAARTRKRHAAHP